MLLELDFSCDIPIYQQIRNQIVLAVAEGKLLPGEKLPSMRTLATESGINTMTVNKAYQLLRQEGYLQIDRRSGAQITLPLTPSGTGQDQTGATLELLSPRLSLLISEARLQGVDKESFLHFCSHIFEEQEAASVQPLGKEKL